MIIPSDIAVGKQVRLKSGSPRLIVTSVESDGDAVKVGVMCWIDDTGIYRDIVPLDALIWPRNVGGD